MDSSNNGNYNNYAFVNTDCKCDLLRDTFRYNPKAQNRLVKIWKPPNFADTRYAKHSQKRSSGEEQNIYQYQRHFFSPTNSICWLPVVSSPNPDSNTAAPRVDSKQKQYLMFGVINHVHVKKAITISERLPACSHFLPVVCSPDPGLQKISVTHRGFNACAEEDHLLTLLIISQGAIWCRRSMDRMLLRPSLTIPCPSGIAVQ